MNKETARFYKEKMKWVIMNSNDKKEPLHKGWQNFTLDTDVNIKEGLNLSVITGKVSNIIVVDVDNKIPTEKKWQKISKSTGVKDWYKLLDKFNNGNDILTLKATTPSGGYHYFFNYNDNVKHINNSVQAILNDKNEHIAIDIRTNKGQILIEPSKLIIDDKIKEYKFNDINIKPIDMPEWLINEITKVQFKEVKKNNKYKKDNNDTITTLELEINNEITNENERQINDLLDLIGNKYDYYKEWFIVGNALKKLNNNLFNVFHQWSKNSTEKYKSEKDCKALWDDVGNYVYTIGTLIYWAKQENKELYAQWCIKYKPISISITYSGLESDIATYIISKYLKLNYISVDIQQKIFFYFNGNRWIEDKNYMKIYNFIKYNFINEIEDIRFKLMNELKTKQENDENFINSKECKSLSGKIDGLFKIIKKVKGKPTFIEDIIKIIAREVYDKDFYNNLNENREIIGFNDGIYDLKLKQFRQGKYNDYCSFSVGYNFPTSYNSNKNELIQFLNQVFPNKDVREYTLQQIAQMLCGNNFGEIIHTHTGIGKNGKSKMTDLLKYTFGDYYYEVPINMLTKNNKLTYNKPDPTLANLKGIRCMIGSEPNEGEEINDALIKKIGSQEEQQYRMLYSNITNVLKYQCKCHIFCNDKLKINGTDDAIVRRMRVIPYESIFREDNIDEKNNIYKVDYSIQKTLFKNRENFMLMLLNLFNYNYEYSMPDIIKEKSKDYIEENNNLKEFIDETIIYTNDDNDILTLNDIWQEYKTYKDYEIKDRKIFYKRVVKCIDRKLYDRKKINNKEYKKLYTGIKLNL